MNIIIHCTNCNDSGYEPSFGIHPTIGHYESIPCIKCKAHKNLQTRKADIERRKQEEIDERNRQKVLKFIKRQAMLGIHSYER